MKKNPRFFRILALIIPLFLCAAFLSGCTGEDLQYIVSYDPDDSSVTIDFAPGENGDASQAILVDEEEAPAAGDNLDAGESSAAAAPGEPPVQEEAPAQPEEQPLFLDDFPVTYDEGIDFDFYVLALSWSPDYCATSGENNTQQCSVGRKLGFVLHGLWPQFEKGYPSNCSKERLPNDLEEEYSGLYPSQNLFDHEWEKHGTCSGLEPEEYLWLSRALKESVTVPASYQTPTEPLRVTTGQFLDDFVAANPAFDESSFAVYCSNAGRYLKELYVCFNTDGSPRACSLELLNRAAKSCAQEDFLVRHVR